MEAAFGGACSQCPDGPSKELTLQRRRPVNGCRGTAGKGLSQGPEAQGCWADTRPLTGAPEPLGCVGGAGLHGEAHKRLAWKLTQIPVCNDKEVSSGHLLSLGGQSHRGSRA